MSVKPNQRYRFAYGGAADKIEPTEGVLESGIPLVTVTDESGNQKTGGFLLRGEWNWLLNLKQKWFDWLNTSNDRLRYKGVLRPRFVGALPTDDSTSGILDDISSSFPTEIEDNQEIVFLEGRHALNRDLRITNNGLIVFAQSKRAVIDNADYSIVIGGDHCQMNLNVTNFLNVVDNGDHNRVIINGMNIGKEAKTLNNRINDINRKTSLPVGTILSFDGENWVDNSTLIGWYACRGQTITLPDNSRYTLPDLRNVFLKASQTSGQTGGRNSYQLSANQMPAHNHSMNHGHGHNFHTSAAGNHRHRQSNTTWPGPSGAEFTHTGRRGVHSDYYTNYAGDHSHRITGGVSSMSGNTGNIGGGQTIDNQPQFYTVVQIRRCF